MRVVTGGAIIFGHLDTIIAFSGISYEKIVQEKDPGNHENGVQVSKISGRVLCRGRGGIEVIGFPPHS